MDGVAIRSISCLMCLMRMPKVVTSKVNDESVDIADASSSRQSSKSLNLVIAAVLGPSAARTNFARATAEAVRRLGSLLHNNKVFEYLERLILRSISYSGLSGSIPQTEYQK